MPKIPHSSAGGIGIGATQIRGAGLAATPVDAVPGAMPTGNGKAGAGFGGIADIAEIFGKAQRENAFQTGKVETYSKIRDLHTQINEETDPEVINTKWQDGIKNIRQGLDEKYKDDDAVHGKLTNLFDDFSNQVGQQVKALSFKRVVDQSKADGMVNDNVLLGTLNKTSGPKDYDWALQLHADDVDSKRATGVYGAVEAEQRKGHFAATVEQLRNAYTEEQRLNGVHTVLAKQFGKTPNAAVKYLENPDNWQQLGIGHKDALHFIGVFDGQAARDKRRADEGRIAGERSELTAYWKAVDSGDLAQASTVLLRARNISGDKLHSMKQALKKDQWDDDPTVVADTLRGIWSGQISDPNALTPKMGNGLSTATTKQLRKDMEIATKDAPEFPGAMNFYANALNRYDMVYPKDSSMHEQQGKFAATLAYQARRQGIGPYDPRMDGLADDLLKVVDKSWFIGADKTKFQRMFDEGNLPIAKPGEAPPVPARPAPVPQATSLGKPSSIQQIPRAEYDMVKAALAQAGRDTSDDTVLSVWLANRDKLKGSK